MSKKNSQNIVIIANFRQKCTFETVEKLTKILEIETIFHPQDIPDTIAASGNQTATFERLRDCLRKNFLQRKTIIALCATGIVIRTLADLLQDKYQESPVLVMAENSSCIIPLLGGHHGGNKLANIIADEFGIDAAITTASENALGFALDALPEGWKISRHKMVKTMMARLLAQQPVALFQQFTDFTFPPPEAFSGQTALPFSVQVTDSQVTNSQHVGLHPPSLVLGIGCERGCSLETLEHLVDETLAQYQLAWQSIAAIATVTLKADEQALRLLAEKYNVEMFLFSPQQLEALTKHLQAPSKAVYQEIGCHSVSEASAIACAGEQSQAVVVKAKNKHATLSIARRPRSDHNSFCPLSGQKLGKLHIIGTGPGDQDNLTLGATAALKDCTAAVGYGLYLDLVSRHIGQAQQFRSPLGEEQKRVEMAITLAQQGQNVALICSGDPGIYALATLVFETLDLMDIRVQFTIKVHAGITAMQAAAAKLGAPLGHDFLAISLSDLLTPSETIKQRLKAAAQGDFVISLYNPQSQTRRTLLPEAIALLLEYRDASTPVAICRNIGRAEEHFYLTTLGDVQPDHVDMLCLVIIGNSTTKFTKNLQNTYLYTPRGYIEPVSITIKD